MSQPAPNMVQEADDADTQRNYERLAVQIVIVSAIGSFLVFGIRLSYSVFYAEFVSVENWSNESSAAVYSVSMIVFAVFSVPSGILLDRYGPRVMFTIGALFLAGGLILSGQARNLTELTISYGLIGGIGLAIMGLGQIGANIAAWVPPDRRGRAIGIAFGGTGLGALVFVRLSTWLIEQIGWQDSFTVLGIISLGIIAPLFAFGQRKPPIPQRTDSAPPRRTSQNIKLLFTNSLFWVMILVSVTALGPLRALTVHQIAYIESVGFERETAANFVGLAGFLTIIAYVTWGYLSDRIGRAWVFTLGGFALIGSVLVLLTLQSTQIPILLILYSLLVALGEGTRSSQSTTLASDIFQDYGLGLVNGIVGGMFGLGAAIGPWVVGFLRDRTDSYLPGLWVVIAMTIVSLFAFIFISRRNQHNEQALISVKVVTESSTR